MSTTEGGDNKGGEKKEGNKLPEIKQLIIKLQTNIPGKENIEFTRDMLYNPSLQKDLVSNSNIYPFITADYEFNADIISHNYNDIYAFFFNKKVFINKLRRNLYGNRIAPNKNRENTLNENINILLQALFPLHSKVSEGYINAFNKNTKGANGSNLFNSIKNKMNFKELYKHIFSLFKNLNYTCLNAGEKYTATRVIWLNDTKTNPVFKQFLRDYRKFKNWKDTQPKVMQDNIKNKTFDQNYSDFNKRNAYNYNYNYSINNRSTADINNPFNDNSVDYNKEEYMSYVDFYKMLKNNSLRNILNKDIKEQIDGVISKYTDKADINKFYNDMDSIYDDPKNITGFRSLSKSGYEINVLMDCIKGEITNENFNTLKCNYNSNKLGELIENKLNKIDDETAFDEDFFKNRKLYSINDNKTLEQPDKGKQNNEAHNQPYNPDYNMPMRFGGKQLRTCNKRRNKCKKIKKTRKNI
jgi:hypothetical protein